MLRVVAVGRPRMSHHNKGRKDWQRLSSGLAGQLRGKTTGHSSTSNLQSLAVQGHVRRYAHNTATSEQHYKGEYKPTANIIIISVNVRQKGLHQVI